MAATASQFYFWFRFREFAHLGKTECTCISNFGEIFQSTVYTLLLPVSESKRPPCWNSISGSIFTFASPSVCHSAYAHQISSNSDHPRQSYDVISIFQDRKKTRKDRTVKKATKALYFTCLGLEAPTESIFTEICTVVAVPT